MNERITVTLPEEMVRDIDRQEKNRSKFILEAVQHELEQRRREKLRRSLCAPHSDSEQMDQEGITDWMKGLPEGDKDLVDIKAGVSVRWAPTRGWINKEE